MYIYVYVERVCKRQTECADLLGGEDGLPTERPGTELSQRMLRRQSAARYE